LISFKKNSTVNSGALGSSFTGAGVSFFGSSFGVSFFGAGAACCCGVVHKISSSTSTTFCFSAISSIALSPSA
jgi:hypothetical protein